MSNAYLPDQGLAFVHVPKTAGFSARIALEAARDEGRLDVDLRPNRGLIGRTTAARWAERCWGRSLWRRARVLAFVRNPWDWTVSGYVHVTRNRPHYDRPPNFRDFVLGRWRRGLGRNPHRMKFATTALSVAYHTQITPWAHLHPSWWRATPPYATIGRYERFPEDWTAFFAAHGVDLPLPAPANRSDRAHYSTYYDDETREAVARRHAPLIARFGYAFEG